jgi:hypothetical protein
VGAERAAADSAEGSPCEGDFLLVSEAIEPLTAQRVRQLLALRGKLRPAIPAKVPTPTERRLQLDRLLLLGGKVARY